MKWAQGMMATLSKFPVKRYNPQYLTPANFFKKFSEVQREAANAGKDNPFGVAYNKLRMETTFRKGVLVGTDYNGNKYYEDRNAPYGRTRWVEYPTPAGWWGLDLRFDGSMVSPEWHGWLHYTHDKTGRELAAEHEKPFKIAHTINQSMQRPEFSREWFGRLDPPMPPKFHQPPGQYASRTVRGRVGPKYQSWSGSPQTTNPAQRNFADNKETLHIP